MEDFDRANVERFNVQAGEFVRTNQARDYGSASEIIADFAMQREDQLDIDLWLRSLWDWALAIDQPVSSLLASSFYERQIISEEEFARYETEKLFKNKLAQS